MEEGVPPEAVAVAAKAVAPPSSPTASQSSASSSASFGEDAPPRIAALFTDAIAAGYVKEREAKGMMTGGVAQLRSGKMPEDACVAQTTKKLAGMKAKFEKKKKQAEKKKQNSGRKRDGENSPPSRTDIIKQLSAQIINPTTTTKHHTHNIHTHTLHTLFSSKGLGVRLSVGTYLFFSTYWTPRINYTCTRYFN